MSKVSINHKLIRMGDERKACPLIEFYCPDFTYSSWQFCFFLTRISQSPWASAGEAKRAFDPPWKLSLRRKIFWKRWNQQFNSD